MASCLVCQSAATLYCNQDKAFLCGACDKTIHSANALSAKHTRMTLCMLCHRSAAVVHCKEDAADLCAECNDVVHAANPVPHHIVPVQAMTAKESEEHEQQHQQLNQQQQQQAANGAAAPPLEDTSSACCGHHQPQAFSPEQQQQQHHHHAPEQQQPGSNNGSEVRSAGVVPQQPAQGGETSAAAAGLDRALSIPKAWGKDELDFLELDNAWLDRLDNGFDFADLLGDAPTGNGPASDAGLVPTLSNSEQQGERSGLTPGGSDELVVPSHAAANFDLSLPGELPMPQLGLLGMKRRASDQASDGFMPAAKQYLETDLQAPYQPRAAPAAYAPQQQQYHQQQHHQWAAYPSAPPPPAQTTHYQQHHQHHNHHHQHALGTGSDMTREERVARYREKRKNRRFQKTIRYASRKAYAEVRPRIKGRFATREEVLEMKRQKDEGMAVPSFS